MSKLLNFRNIQQLDRSQMYICELNFEKLKKDENRKGISVSRSHRDSLNYLLETTQSSKIKE